MNIQYLSSLYWPINSFSSSLSFILYELYKKKEARAMVKAILANIPRLRVKSQAKSSAWPKLLALWATWLPGNLTGQRASLSGKGESTASERDSQERTYCRSCWDSGGKGSKQELPSLIYLLYDPRLLTQ